MPIQEMTRFRLRLIGESNTNFQILLVEEPSGQAPRIAAEFMIEARQATMPRMMVSSSDHDTIFDAARVQDKRVMGLEEALDTTGLGDFAAFRSSDTARGMISDAAYSWLLMNVVQTYDQGAIDLEDDHFVIRGNGIAMAPHAARGGAGGKNGTGRPRPKSSKKLSHGWF